MKKQLISIILTTAIVSSFLPQFAYAEEDILLPRKVREVTYEETQQTETEEETTEHTEIIENFEFPEEGIYDPWGKSISTFALTDEQSKIWQAAYAEQLGNDYLMPSVKSTEAQRVEGNTNRLVVEETDLHLPGKNGLDVVIKRKHDNQESSDTFSASRVGGDLDVEHYRYVYTFSNADADKSIKIGFLSQDHYYIYMSEAIAIGNYSGLTKENGETNTGTKLSYYRFEDIKPLLTSSQDAEVYESDGEYIACVKEYPGASSYEISSLRLLFSTNTVGLGGRLLFPELFTEETYFYSYKNSAGDKQYCDRECVGTFVDMHGNTSTLFLSESYKREDGTYTSYSYDYTIDGNPNLTLCPLVEIREIDGIEYNFTVRDKRGFTYYLYDTGFKANTVGSKHKAHIRLIKDDYGNSIKYEHTEDFNKVTKIIDTYGREINISDTENGKQLSYYDDIANEMQYITYENETLPATEIDNDSILKNKEISRLSVTNPAGEQTIYDGRRTEIINAHKASANITHTNYINSYPDISDHPYMTASDYNIERIIYPNGDETRYHYKMIFPYDSSTKITRYMYAVDESYDISDGEIVNKKQYTFYKKNTDFKKTCIEDDIDRKTVQEYNELGQPETVTITSISGETPKRVTTYTYDANRNVNLLSTVEDDVTTQYIKRTYNTDHTVATEYDWYVTGVYTYHSNGMIKDVTYYSGQNTSIANKLFSNTTTLTEDGRDIEYERIVEDNVIKSQTKYEYDSEGNISKAIVWTDDTNADGVLDENDDVIIQENEYILTNQKTYNVTQKLKDLINADGESEGDITQSYSLSIYSKPISATDSYGNITTVEYDNIGRPIKYTMPDNGVRTIEYSDSGTTATETDQNGKERKYEYDIFGNVESTYEKIDDSFVLVAENIYDDYTRLKEKITYTDENKGTKEVYSYDSLDRVAKKEVYELPATLLYTESYTYSGRGYDTIVTIQRNGGAIQSATETSYYNMRGKPTQKTVTDGISTMTSTYTYDALGNLITKTDPMGNATSYEYDCLGNTTKQTDALGNITTAVYDMAGRQISVTDPMGNTTNTYYDSANRVVKVEAPFDDESTTEVKSYYDKNSNVTKTATLAEEGRYVTEEFTYDNMGNVKTATKGDSVVSYDYDLVGNITKQTVGGDRATNYEYNSRGLLAKITDPMGIAENYTSYDYQGNLLSKTDKNGVEFAYTYGPFGITKEEADGEYKQYSYDNLGRQIMSQNITSAEEITDSYTYDAFGRLLSKTANGNTHSYTYDSNSNVTGYQLKDNSGVLSNITYQYDALNRLGSMVHNGFTTTYTYDANSRLTQKSTNNGVVSSYVYNNAGYYESATNHTSGAENNVTYDYAPNGNLLSKTSTSEGAAYSYTYDNSGRLSSESAENIATGDVAVADYTYDAYGNRIKKELAGTTIDYLYDANNRLIKQSKYTDDTERDVHEYSYDNNGNQKLWLHSIQVPETEDDEMSLILETVTDGTDYGIYNYDKFNRLNEYTNGVTTASYTYGADNLRRSKTVNGVTTSFHWDGQNLFAQTSQGGEYDYFAYDASGVLSANIDNAPVLYLYEHNSVSATANTSGAISSNTYAYDAFGNQKNANTNDTNPFRYCGEYFDAETGMVYLRNRYYDADLGRFVTEDPAKDGLNWYVYCGNDPVGYVDPLGLDAIVITTSTASVYANAHTSVLVQDKKENWYYFYWGDKNAVLLEVPSEKLQNLDIFNEWLIEKGAGKNGKKTDKPLHDSSADYTTGTYIEGDFSKSVNYFVEQAKGANMSEDIKDGKHEYTNNSYSLSSNNCMTVSFDGLRKGILSDGTGFNSFAKFDGVGSIRPNDFRVMIRETFANQEFTKSAARNSAIGTIGVKKPFYMSQNYYNQGQKYGKMLRGY